VVVGGTPVLPLLLLILLQGIQLYLLIQDALIQFNGFSQVTLIDSVPIDIDAQVGTLSEAMLYTGSAGIAQINASFDVRCAVNFTGWDCLTFCPDFQSCAECGLPDFAGEYCQVSINCSCNGSNTQCVYVGNGNVSCQCETGFTGEDCETPIDYCAGVTCSGNGRCLDLIGSFSCVCERGYTGILCEAEIDECTSVTCGGNGRCVNRLHSFVCECFEGYTGDLCEKEGTMVVLLYHLVTKWGGGGRHSTIPSEPHSNLKFPPSPTFARWTLERVHGMFCLSIMNHCTLKTLPSLILIKL
jgi:hypothetical protein